MMSPKVKFEKLPQDELYDNGHAVVELVLNNDKCLQDKVYISSDDEDEVYVRDSNHDPSVSRPLMYPRKRTKVKVHQAATCRRIFRPIAFIIVSLIFAVSMIVGVKFIVKKFRDQLTIHKQLLESVKPSSAEELLIGCSNIEVEDVWVRGIPKFITETAIRNVDINGDGVYDHLIAFGTGAVNEDADPLVCNIYFNGSFPCFGGILALNGVNGREIWRYYSRQELFALNCNTDFNRDGVLDCLGGGRAGAFSLVSGKNGKEIWTFDAEEARKHYGIMNLYTAQPIKDFNGDGIPEVLAIHGGDPLREPGSKYRLFGRIIIFSGKDGSVLKANDVPDYKESYYSPQIHTLMDGTQVVLFGTGGETHPGSFWYVGLDDLYKGNIDRAKKVYSDKFKGIMTPPVLIDLTGDGVEDIVLPSYNSTTVVFDGQTFKQLWKYHVPGSESYSTPAAGYFNDDDIPDFMVHWQIGPGYPIYYYSITTILDGRTGKPIIEPIRDSVGAQSSPLTISVEGRGNDIFLYWIADCFGHEKKGGEFTFLDGTNIHEQSRSDFCRLRFKTSGFSKMYAISSNVKAPGIEVYYSLDRKGVERAAWVNTTQEGIEFVRQHPEHRNRYLKFVELNKIDMMNKPANQLENNKYKPPINSNKLRNSQDDLENYSPSNNHGDQYKPYPDESDTSLLNEFLDRYGSDDGVDDGSENLFPRKSTQQSSTRRRPYPVRQQSTRGMEHLSNHEGVPGRRRIVYRPYQRQRQERSYIPKKGYSTPMRTGLNVETLMRNKKFKKIVNRKLDDEHNKIMSKIRKKRHLGPHDDSGLQRLLSTGTLTPTLLDPTHPNYNQSIDLVFATYWFYPAKTKILLPEDEKCIKEFMEKEMRRFNPKSEYFHMDRDAYNHAAKHECLERSDHKTKFDKDQLFQSQTSYNPFNLMMGQMTVYRVRITCNCLGDKRMQLPNARCSRVLPYHQQEWAAYMGTYGDSHWNSRDRPRLYRKL